MIFPLKKLVDFGNPTKPAASRKFYEEVYVMKKFISSIFVFLLMAVFLTSVAASSASAADIAHSGYTQDPWYASIDSAGTLTGELPDIFQNSAQYVIYRPGFSPTYILSAHPNYEPSSDDPFTAQTTTLVTAIQVYNGNTKQDCTVGGTFQAPRTYIQYTSANVPYLRFSITFTKYNSYDGAEIGTYSFDPVFFALESIVPPPAPSYEF
jgi:hypothetical protein